MSISPIIDLSNVEDFTSLKTASIVRTNHICGINRPRSRNVPETGKVEVYFNIRTTDQCVYAVNLRPVPPDVKTEAFAFIESVHADLLHKLTNGEQFIAIQPGELAD